MPSITRRTRSGAERRADVESRLLGATVRLLAGGESITELGVQRIVAEAGVARSSFYAHFPDKTALLLRMTEDLHQKSYELVSVWQQDDSANTLESLLTLYRGVVTLYRENWVLLTTINEAAAYDPVVRQGMVGAAGPVRRTGPPRGCGRTRTGASPPLTSTRSPPRASSSSATRRPSSGTSPATAEPATRPSPGNSH
jgi:AcrR family transcriptional regulator